MSSSSDPSDASAKATTVIGTPNHNDVLLGRGAVCREHPGTKLFHAMCRSHSVEFGSSNRHEAKNIVAYRILNSVRSAGGRFLQPCSSGGGGYTEMSRDVALRKTKQSIRDSKNSPDSAPATDESESWRQHQRREESRRARRQEHEQQDPRNATVTTTAPDEVDEVEEQFYSLLTESDEKIPKFSAEDWRLEREKMTEEERISVQKDVLGSSQFESLFIQQPIQPGRSTSFSLLQKMRQDIERRRGDSSAVGQALEKATDRREFSDARLESFLWRENMNPQTATQRLANYWEKRRELFGKDKYLAPMTPSDSLSDGDLHALRTCTFQALPIGDTSGRQLLLRDYSLDTKEGYSSKNLLRAFWYLLEVIAKNGNEGSAGNFVLVIWARRTTIWDFDRNTDSQLYALERDYLPVTLCACHFCCPPFLTEWILRPVSLALQETRTRQRTKIHSVPPSQIVSVLAEYGIHKDVLPSAMGGTFQPNMSDWIASRRSLEMDEM